MIRGWRIRSEGGRRASDPPGPSIKTTTQQGRIGDIDGSGGEYALTALDELLSTLSLSSGEFVHGVSTDFVLRGYYYTSPHSYRVAESTEAPRIVHCMINVEVDGLHHRLGRKRRFQQLRDEHLATAGTVILIM